MRLPFGLDHANGTRFPDLAASVTAVRELLAEALSDRYSLERELGRGSMATVFLARDVRHRRPVAVKVMHPSLAGALDSERFLREIEIAASLSHPLIVPLYDSGNARGFLYYIMPYVEGESLYGRLRRERRLSLEDALQITHDVAQALGYAHSRGVLHRDVKPENILLAGGHALIADFGLARALATADHRKLTETGVIVGTPFYMSPEQLREDSDLDQRADIYGLGCILYEMLTGGPPYTGRSLKELATRILRAPVPSVQRLQADVPAAVDQAISKALAKSAAERFGTMQEFAAALPQRHAGSTPAAATSRAGSGDPPDASMGRAEPPGTPPAERTPAGRGGVLGGLIRALRSLVSPGRRS
ncbi:MAG: serine/threonine-protein kinase [Gemmatimonadales bacterium]